MSFNGCCYVRLMITGVAHLFAERLRNINRRRRTNDTFCQRKQSVSALPELQIKRRKPYKFLKNQLYYCFSSHQILISVYVCTLHRNVHTYPLPSITAQISLIHHTNYRRMMYSYWHVPIFLPSKYVHYIAVCNDAVSFQWYFRTSKKKHR